MKEKSRLKQFRIEKTNFSQKEMAEKLQINQQAYSLYELQNRKLNDDFLIKLYEEYSVSPLWLLTGHGPQQIEDYKTAYSLETQVQSTKYKFDINASESIELIIRGHKVNPKFNNVIKNSLTKIILETILTAIQTKLPDNFKFYFFIKYLNTINKDDILQSTYKDYMLDKAYDFESDIFYTETHKKDLIKIIGALDEAACKHIIKNIDLAIQQNYDKVDSLTKFTDKYIFPIRHAQSFVKFFVPNNK